MTAVLTANSDYGRLGIKQQIELNDTGNRWIANGAAFALYCGTKLAIIEHRASRVSVIITIDNVSSDDQSDMSTSLSAQGGWGPMNVKASANFDQQLARSVGAQQVQIQVVATGGAGLSALSDLLKGLASNNSISSIQSIKDAMGGYLKDFSSQNPAPVSYDVVSMGFLGWDGSALDIWSDLRQRHLKEMVTSYRDLSDKIDTIDSVTSGADARATHLSAGELGQLPVLRASYDAQRSVLATAHKQCMSVPADPCNVPPSPTFAPNPIPNLPAAPSGNYALLRDDVDHSHDPYPPTNPYTVLSAIQTRAALAGINPWSDGLIRPLPPTPPAAVFNWPDVKLAQLAGAEAWLVYLLEGTGIVDPIRVAYRADGTSTYIDLPITALNGCPANGYKNLNRLQNVSSTVQFCVPMEQGRLAAPFFTNGNIVSLRGGLVDQVMQWIYNQAQVNNPPQPDGCTENVKQSATFFLHVFDNYGREFYLPILKASWVLSHFYRDDAFGCFNNDTLTLDIIQ